MPSRRQFLKSTAATGTLGTASPGLVLNSSPRITSAIRRDETSLRYGVGGDWYLTWRADDTQVLGLGVGTGPLESETRMFQSHLFAVRNGPADATFENMTGYPVHLRPRAGVTNPPPTYIGNGLLAVDKRIYQFIATASKGPNWQWNGSKLVYSQDNGAAWLNQDGSPMRWEGWDERSRKSMVFYEEPQNVFSLTAILQMGRGYRDNKDGYVYVYSPNGFTEGTANELVIFRVAKDRILNRSAYEYFAGRNSRGGVRWSRDIYARAPIHTFPRGWVPRTAGVHTWHPSVAYNAALGIYMMINWACGVSSEGIGYVKPSYLGIWTARDPWGPWDQVHEETAWLVKGNPATIACVANIAPKWIAKDGKSFWLVWTDMAKRGKAEHEQFQKEVETMSEDERLRQSYRRLRWSYAFNVQRVDLKVM